MPVSSKTQKTSHKRFKMEPCTRMVFCKHRKSPAKTFIGCYTVLLIVFASFTTATSFTFITNPSRANLDDQSAMQFYQQRKPIDEEQKSIELTVESAQNRNAFDNNAQEKARREAFVSDLVDVYKRNMINREKCFRPNLLTGLNRIFCDEENALPVPPLIDDLLRNVEENLRRERQALQRAASQLEPVGGVEGMLAWRTNREPEGAANQEKRSESLRQQQQQSQARQQRFKQQQTYQTGNLRRGKVSNRQFDYLQLSARQQLQSQQQRYNQHRIKTIRLNRSDLNVNGGNASQTLGPQTNNRQQQEQQTPNGGANMNQYVDQDGSRLVLNGRVPSLSNSTSEQQNEQQQQQQANAESMPLGCHKRLFRFRAVKSDRAGNKCSGYVTASACYGGCDTGEFANHVFPYKKSVHKVCTHGKRVPKSVRLSDCSSIFVPESLREYHYVDAGSCVCKTCTPLDTTCLGSISRPQLRGFNELQAPAHERGGVNEFGSQIDNNNFNHNADNNELGSQQTSGSTLFYSS